MSQFKIFLLDIDYRIYRVNENFVIDRHIIRDFFCQLEPTWLIYF